MAAAVWASAEPAARRLLGTTHSTVALVGGAVMTGRARGAVGLLGHCAFGAAFAVAFARAGGRGVAAGVVAAETENVLLWPALALVDRRHPDPRLRGRSLVRDPRVFAQEAAMHALFGAVVGRLAATPRRPPR